MAVSKYAQAGGVQFVTADSRESISETSRGSGRGATATFPWALSDVGDTLSVMETRGATAQSVSTFEMCQCIGSASLRRRGRSHVTLMATNIEHQNEQRIAHCQYSNSGAQINNVNTNCFLTSLAGCAVCLMTKELRETSRCRGAAGRRERLEA